MDTTYRLAHSRFNQGVPVRRSQPFDRVVTSVWSFDPENSILTYGSTIFNKDSHNDHWDKKKHHAKALERFVKNPLRIVLESSHNFELCNISIDWFISQKLVYRFGTHNNQLDVRRLHGTITVPDDFNNCYSPFSESDDDDQVYQTSDCSGRKIFCYMLLGASLALFGHYAGLALFC